MGAWLDRVQQLRDVLYGQVEPRFLQMGAAASRVDDQQVDADPLEHVLQPARPRSALLAAPGMEMQRTTAALFVRHHDLAALGGQNARGGLVDISKEDLLHTAGHQAHTHPRCALRGGQGGPADPRSATVEHSVNGRRLFGSGSLLPRRASGRTARKRRGYGTVPKINALTSHSSGDRSRPCST